MNDSPTKILGIDPSTTTLGWCLAESNPLNIINYGVIKFKSKQKLESKLYQIFVSISNLIEKDPPHVLGIENVFMNLGAMSSFAMQGAKTACIIAFIDHYQRTHTQENPPIHQISPKVMKKKITGNGNATKEEVAKTVSSTFNLNIDGLPLDATDAIGIAYCTHMILTKQDN